MRKLLVMVVADADATAYVILFNNLIAEWVPPFAVCTRVYACVQHTSQRFFFFYFKMMPMVPNLHWNHTYFQRHSKIIKHKNITSPRLWVCCIKCMLKVMYKTEPNICIMHTFSVLNSNQIDSHDEHILRALYACMCECVSVCTRNRIQQPTIYIAILTYNNCNQFT